MTEATRAVIAYGFGELGLHRIESSCFTRYPASARVLVKAGMVIEGVMRHSAPKNGTYEEVAVYAVIHPPDHSGKHGHLATGLRTIGV